MICLPKSHDQYQYFDLQTKEYVGRSETIVRNPKETGRFIYENQNGIGEFPLHVLLEINVQAICIWPAILLCPTSM